MQKLGKGLQISGSGKLILRTKIKVKVGIRILNEELKSIGIISDVFGPVKNPYVSVKPISGDLDNYIGKPLYIMAYKKRRPS